MDNPATFAAIKLEGLEKNALTSTLATLRTPDWQHPDDYHITLAYLGHAIPAQQSLFLKELCSCRLPPPELTIVGAGVLKTDTECVVHAGIQHDQTLIRIWQTCQTALVAAGLPRSRFPVFTPHVTLLRLPRNRVDEACGIARSIPPLLRQFTAESIAFCEKRPAAQGPQYRMLAQIGFDKNIA
ncbi:MAG: RNA 2',3'-cyclic phosphodiesterase [Pseudomonadaceae bacterium]|nr:RNA 2',3'-cyclic phosphodiesterase [Pseudomonadaceae bacterium]